MTVPTTLADLSTSEGSNSPLDSDSVTPTTRPSDYLRAHAAILRTLAASSTIAAGATTDLSTVTGTFITLTGAAATITSLGTLAAGIYKGVIYNAAHTMTHNGTSLILLGGANRTVAAGDFSLFLSEGAGNWRELVFSDTSASYQPLDAQLTTLAGITAQQATDLAALSPFMGTVLNDADAATARATLGAAASSDIQAVDGEFRSQQIFTSSGTWAKPAGLKRVKVTVVGGGGGGSNSISSFYIANGGAGGGTAIKVIEASSLGATETVTVGAGGTGATGAATAAGSAGGTSSFGAHCSATGGSGGAASDGTSNSWDNTAIAQGGMGTGGDINLPGSSASAPPVSYSGGVLAYKRSSGGGDSTHGAGGAIGVYPSHGQAGAGYGAGGAGGITNSSTDYNGGNGAAGIVIVEEFF